MLVCVMSGWPVVSAELKSRLIHIDKVIYKVYYQCIKVRTATKVLKAKLSTVASRRKLPQTQQGEQQIRWYWASRRFQMKKLRTT